MIKLDEFTAEVSRDWLENLISLAQKHAELLNKIQERSDVESPSNCSSDHNMETPSICGSGGSQSSNMSSYQSMLRQNNSDWRRKTNNDVAFVSFLNNETAFLNILKHKIHGFPELVALREHILKPNYQCNNEDQNYIAKFVRQCLGKELSTKNHRTKFRSVLRKIVKPFFNKREPTSTGADISVYHERVRLISHKVIDYYFVKKSHLGVGYTLEGNMLQNVTWFLPLDFNDVHEEICDIHKNLVDNEVRYVRQIHKLDVDSGLCQSNSVILRRTKRVRLEDVSVPVNPMSPTVAASQLEFGDVEIEDARKVPPQRRKQAEKSPRAGLGTYHHVSDKPRSDSPNNLRKSTETHHKRDFSDNVFFSCHNNRPIPGLLERMETVHSSSSAADPSQPSSTKGVIDGVVVREAQHMARMPDMDESSSSDDESANNDYLATHAKVTQRVSRTNKVTLSRDDAPDVENDKVERSSVAMTSGRGGDGGKQGRGGGKQGRGGGRQGRGGDRQGRGVNRQGR